MNNVGGRSGAARGSQMSSMKFLAMPGAWTPEPFEADDGSIPFQRFIDDLSDFKFVALDAAIDRVLSIRGIELVRTEWLKALGGGLHEFRGRHDAEEIARMFGGRDTRSGRAAGEGSVAGLRPLLR